MSYVALVLFWALFFRGIIRNPYSAATADVISVWYSHARYLGNTKSVYDPYHFGDCASIPFTGVWNPFQWIISHWISLISLDRGFVLYTFYIYLHYLLASICWYMVFGNLFCAITLTYAMRFVTSCPPHCVTWGWLSFAISALCLGHPVVAAVGCYLAIAGGYWPLIIYASPLILLYGASYPLFYVVSLVLCLPQLLVTAYYLKRSVRTKQTYDKKAIGSVPPWHFISMIIPMKLSLNGVPYPELSYSIGRVALVIAIMGLSWPLAALSLLGVYLAMGRYSRAPIIGRVPARAMYITTFALVYACSLVIPQLDYTVYYILLALQAADILINHPGLLFYEPFVEMAGKPSKLFNTHLSKFLKGKTGRVSNLPHPLYAGHILGVMGLGYSGSSMTLRDAEKRGITDPNGDGDAQDWFLHKSDGQELDDYGIKYAYKPAVNDLEIGRWMATEVQYLWQRVN